MDSGESCSWKEPNGPTSPMAAMRPAGGPDSRELAASRGCGWTGRYRAQTRTFLLVLGTLLNPLRLIGQSAVRFAPTISTSRDDSAPRWKPTTRDKKVVKKLKGGGNSRKVLLASGSPWEPGILILNGPHARGGWARRETWDDLRAVPAMGPPKGHWDDLG